VAFAAAATEDDAAAVAVDADAAVEECLFDCGVGAGWIAGPCWRKAAMMDERKKGR
jgi:hypothetical protein